MRLAWPIWRRLEESTDRVAGTGLRLVVGMMIAARTRSAIVMMTVLRTHPEWREDVERFMPREHAGARVS
jgi:hypothetical protein